VHITGNRYQFSGQKMPKFKEWAETVVGIDINNPIEAQKEIPIDPPIENKPFIEALRGHVDDIVTTKLSRINHSHGHSLQELFMLRNSRLPRTVDYVVYITNHEQAEYLIKAAETHKVVLIPFGGYAFK
jgi:alkyldihydroxyacetonephosphate synthase